MTYQKYLNTVLPRLVKGAHGIEDPAEKDLLTMDRLFKECGEKIIPPVVKDQCVGTYIHKSNVLVQTDKMREPKPQPPPQPVVASGRDSRLPKKSKNQLILDKAMEEEFLRTL